MSEVNKKTVRIGVVLMGIGVLLTIFISIPVLCLFVGAL